MIRQKSKEQRDFEAECCLVLDGLELQGNAIRAIHKDPSELMDSSCKIWKHSSSLGMLFIF
uniref:Uncharacterized protein n=1 Tax=Anguilla anguilla TaxID=7936 RepID=A0A0E9QN62_ANGAN